jgi:hypothetical protein
MAVKIIDNCCSPMYLEKVKFVASQSENWNLYHPFGDHPIEDKFLKLNVVQNGVKHPVLAGLAIGLLIQIHEAGGQGLFVPEIITCGISIKDKHRPDNIHTDFEKEDGIVKILGIINSDWEEKWGGGFFHGETNYYIKPTSFGIFNRSIPHSATEIFTDKKRLVIDFTVFRDQQSLEKAIKKG